MNACQFALRPLPVCAVSPAVSIVLCMFLVALVGCSAETGAGEHPPEPVNPNLPVVNLPRVDFGQETTPANDEPSPLALGSSIPATEFVIRFEGQRAPGKKHYKYVMCNVKQRRPEGDLFVVAACFVEPRGDLNQEIAIYEGACEAPKRAGEHVVEVKYGKTFLVRSAEVR